MTFFSIIVPVYKGKAYISNLIKMAEDNWTNLNAEIKAGVELIFVNDFPDEKIVINNAEHNIKVTVIENERNMGIHASRVQGLAAAKSEYVLFLDQDDEISSQYLVRQLNKLGNNDAIICNGKSQGILIYRNEIEQKNAVSIKEYRKGNNRIVSPGQALIRKKAIPELWSREILMNNGADDYYLWYLMLSEHRRLETNPDILYRHVTTDNNLSADVEKMRVSISETLDIFEKNNVIPGDEIAGVRNYIKPVTDISVMNRKYQRCSLYLNILSRWLTLKEDGWRMEEYFKRENLKEIAIYGAGILGQHLEKELRNTNISVKYFIDRDAGQNNNIYEHINLISLDDAFEQVDAIVVTPVWDYQAIESVLREKCSYKIISINMVVSNVDIDIC